MHLLARLGSLGPFVPVALALGLLPAVARADALPPAQDCPSGQIWVHSHGGGCTPEAPDDCAPGWRGQVGGQCLPHVPLPEANPPCPSGLELREVTLCLMHVRDHGNGRVRFEPPREYDVPVGVVGPSAPCEGAERKPAPGGVCVAPGKTPAAAVLADAGAPGPREPRTGCGRGCEAGEGAGLVGLFALAARVRRRRAPTPPRP